MALVPQGLPLPGGVVFDRPSIAALAQAIAETAANPLEESSSSPAPILGEMEQLREEQQEQRVDAATDSNQKSPGHAAGCNFLCRRATASDWPRLEVLAKSSPPSGGCVLNHSDTSARALCLGRGSGHRRLATARCLSGRRFYDALLQTDIRLSWLRVGAPLPPLALRCRDAAA